MDNILTECNSTRYPRPPANAGNQIFPSPFLPGTAVNYTCANGFALMNEQTFMCNASDGSFTPSTPPNCVGGIDCFQNMHNVNIDFCKIVTAL